MSPKKKFNKFLGLLAGTMLNRFPKKPPKPTAEDLKKSEFKTSTQSMGIRFTEKLRDIFRKKWIRKQN